MSYATFEDVLARAGRARIALGQANAPDETEVERFLDDVAGEIDGRLVALGLTAPTVDAVAKAALRGVNADGALILTLDATFPAEQSDKAAGRLLDRTERRYTKAMDQIKDGTFPAIAALVATTIDATAASDFWSSDPTYDLATRTSERMTRTPSVLPGVEKGMGF